MPDHLSYLSALYGAAITALLGFAAWRDVAIRTIPDSVSIALLAAGVVMRGSQGWSYLTISLLMSAAMFLLLLPLCSRGLLGGADLKLLSALAVGLSPQSSVSLLLAVTTIGGLLAAVYLLAAKRSGSMATMRSPSTRVNSRLARVITIESWRIRRRAPLPYGIAIAIGAAIVVLQQRGV